MRLCGAIGTAGGCTGGGMAAGTVRGIGKVMVLGDYIAAAGDSTCAFMSAGTV